MLPLNRRQLVNTARYLVTVPVAAVILIVLRWDGAASAGERMALVADAVWQAAVWPLYLLLLIFGAVK